MTVDAGIAAWPEVAAALNGGVAVLPFGACEQHGHHLPQSTDTIVAQAVAAGLAERLDAVLLPAVPYGETWNMAGYPGTLSLKPSTVRAIVEDLADALAEANCAALVIVNGDWGNRAPLTEAVAAIEAHGRIRAISLDYPGLDAAAARIRESVPAAPGQSIDHAGELETSLLLHLAPTLVDPSRFSTGYPEFPPGFGESPMQLHPFSRSGVFGDPSSASAAKGAALLAATLDESERAVREWLAG